MDLAFDRSRIIPIVLSALPETVAIYGHGSFFGGQPHPSSDVDLALLLPVGVSPSATTMAELSGDLEATVGKRVDLSLLDLGRQVILCKEVVAHGEPIFVADERSLAEFEMNALSRYASLCEDREPVLRAYSKEIAGE